MRSTSTLALFAFGASTTVALADGDPWALLDAIEIDEVVTENSYSVTKTYPLAIANGAESFAITGFAVPMYPGVAGRSVLLVSDMGDCPFCGSPDHGAALEVELDEPLLIEEGQRLSLVGALELIHDPETWQAAILRGAKVVATDPS